MRKFQLGVLAVLLAALGMSCAGSSSAEAEPKALTVWKEMNKEERAAYMKKTVMPQMKAEFVSFDAKEFGEMSCATCHGDGAKDKSFKMPNPKLPKLVASEEGFKKLSADHPEMMTFMSQKVVPDMVALLGVAPYDPKTQKGFGCFACHTMKGSGAHLQEGKEATKTKDEASVIALMDKHFTALNELDPEKRRALITEVYDPHIILIDPYVTAHGRAEFEKVLDEIHKQSPGFVFRVVDDIEVHHEFARIHWDLAKPGASEKQTGDDFVKIKEGRIVEIIAFMNGQTRRAQANHGH